MAKVVCEGVNKKCNASYGVHTYDVVVNDRSVGQKTLCVSCRTTMERAKYTLTQLAEVPVARQVTVQTPKGKSDPSAWQSWIDGD